MLPRKKAHGDTPPVKTCARKNLGNRSVSGLSSLKLCRPPYPIGPRRGKGQAWDAEHKHLAQFKAKPQRRGSTAPARAKPWGQGNGTAIGSNKARGKPGAQASTQRPKPKTRARLWQSAPGHDPSQAQHAYKRSCVTRITFPKKATGVF